MPKMKTRKAVKKRFKVTGTGKLVRSKPGRRHNLGGKSSKHKRSLGKRVLVSDDQTKMYKLQIGA